MISALNHAHTLSFHLPPPKKRGSAMSSSSAVRIAVVGDVHDDWDLQDDTKALQLLQPDLVLFTGDFGDENVELVQSVADLEFPKAVILGNHDSWKTQQFSGKKKDGVQLQLECHGEEHVAYRRLDFPTIKLSVIGGRPFSCGGEQIFRKKLLSARFGVQDMDGSAKRIYNAVRGTPEDHLVIVLAHNGPTEDARLGLRVHLVDMSLGRCAPWTKSQLGGHDPRRTRALDQESTWLESSESGSSESPILGGSGAVESEQDRDSECSFRSESSLPPGITRGEEFSIPPEVGLRIPNEGERAIDPEPGSAAFHPSFMELGVRLPLKPYLRRFLRDIGLAPAQISPNGWRVLIGMWSLWKVLGIKTDLSFAEIQHCYKLAPHTHGGDGWWYLASWTKQAGEGLITGLPISKKEWKKTWFIATDWGRELSLRGMPMRVRSVFGFLAVWERIQENQLTPDERRHVAAAWKTHSRERHVNHLLGDRLLSSFGFIPVPTLIVLRLSKTHSLEVVERRRKQGEERASMETLATDRPEEGVAEDVRPLKVRPPRFKEVSSEAGGGLGGDQTPSEERVGGDSFQGPPPMYSQERTPTGQAGFGGPFSPDDSVDFMCFYARNFMRSGDSGGAGKISNNDRKMESELIIKKDTCSSLERELEKAKNEISSLKARLAHLEALAVEGVKATEYRERLRKFRALVKRLRRELPDRAIDSWIRSSEYTKAIDEEFDRGATDTKYLISRVDPNFDFEKLEEIRAEEWAKGGATKEVGDPIVEEDSLDLEDVMLTDPEVESAFE
ncbi:hypothetical protein ACOSQ4_012562 [Xanthoceras sorbifolium]